VHAAEVQMPQEDVVLQEQAEVVDALGLQLFDLLVVLEVYEGVARQVEASQGNEILVDLLKQGYDLARLQLAPAQGKLE